MVFTDVGVVVVHHRNFPTVLTTLDALLRAGVAEENCVLVDNSEDMAIEESLQARIPARMLFVSMRNLGYAAAVNVGIRKLEDSSVGFRFVLIATHETVPNVDAVAALRSALLADAELAVAGPTLVHTVRGDEVVWSTGGTLSSRLRVPQHTGWGQAATSSPLVRIAPVYREWLDGAFCMYRREALESTPLDEGYFLYFEETDCHVRLGRNGWKVGWVPASVVRQSSDGTPPYWKGRNLYIFQQRHGLWPWRTVAVLSVGMRTAAAGMLRGLGFGPAIAYARGARDGSRFVRGRVCG